MKEIAYEYRNIPIPGGGYVTGLCYHESMEDILYARTDIGGVYRFEAVKRVWKSLGDHITPGTIEESYPIAIALDDHNSSRLYIACGRYGESEGTLCVSDDRGNHFDYYSIPVPVHGNLSGRGTGERLVVSKVDCNTLYFASQTGGLLISHDRGRSWEKNKALPELFLTFVFVSPDEKVIVVGSAGVTNQENCKRGHSLYVSYDRGDSFMPLSEPKSPNYRESIFPGHVAQRYSFDGKYLYVTFSQTGRSGYIPELSYSCDSGDALGGMVVRYDFLRNGKISSYADITPTAANTVRLPYNTPESRDDRIFTFDDEGNMSRNAGYDFGFSGISSCKASPGLLALSTICRKQGDKIYYSSDYGDHWQVILLGTVIGNLVTRAPYLAPELYDNRSTVHWVSDVKINPFNPEELWINSGTGLFRCMNLADNKRVFTDWNDGIEETVHMAVYSPLKGGVKCIDLVGDIGGFGFTGLFEPAKKPFMDENNHKYVTCINADYSDAMPGTVIVTARGNWTGTSKGGLIISRDLCNSFTRIKMPYGITPYIDSLLRNIEMPNVDPGFVAMSPDGGHIVWCVGEGDDLFFDGVIVSHNGGYTFSKSKVVDKNGFELSDGKIKVFSDRIRNDLFFGFGDNGRIYVSTDYGETFVKKNVPTFYPSKVDFGTVNLSEYTEIRGEYGKSGVFYIAAGNYGLFKMEYLSETGDLNIVKLSKDKDCVYRIGLGCRITSNDSGNKMLYFSGVIDREYGFFRSPDDLMTIEKINSDSQMYGDINSIDGDKRIPGRFYIGTGTRGLLFGFPKEES